MQKHELINHSLLGSYNRAGSFVGSYPPSLSLLLFIKYRPTLRCIHHNLIYIIGYGLKFKFSTNRNAGTLINQLYFAVWIQNIILDPYHFNRRIGIIKIQNVKAWNLLTLLLIIEFLDYYLKLFENWGIEKRKKFHDWTDRSLHSLSSFN